MSKKLTTEEFVQKVKQIHGDKYDYSKTQYINIHKDVCIICSKHGEFWQRADNHICKKYGCPKCKTEKIGNLKRKSLEQFIEDARKIHGDKYDYSKVEYINSYTPVCIICSEHGEFYQIPHTHLTGKGCKKCRGSKGEDKIARIFESKNIRFIHDENCLEFLGELRPDFYLPDYNLIIEYDGEQHFKSIEIFGGVERFEKTQELDALKTQLCEEHNIKLVRISYTQFNEIERIIDSIVC